MKTKITCLVLLLFLCSIWVLTFFISKRLEHEMTVQIEAQQFSIASYIADSIEGQVRLRINSLTAIANMITPELLANPGKLREFLYVRPLLATLFQTGVEVISREGIGIADYPVLQGRAGSSRSELEYFKEVVATGKPVVGKPWIGRFSNKRVISFAVPILNPSGKFIAVLAGYTLLSDPALLGSIGNLAYKDFSDRLTLVSPKYRMIVTGTDQTRIMTPTPEPGVNPLHDKFMAGFEGSGIYVNSRGIRMLSSGKQIPTPGWFVRLGLPTEMAFAPIHSMQNWIYSMALGLSIVSSVLVLLLIRQAMRPLYVANRLIKDITEERLPPQDIPVTQYDEIGQLLTSFNLHLRYRKQVEAEREQFYKFFQASSDLMVIADPNGAFMKTNPTCTEILGYSETELVAKPFIEFIHPEDKQSTLDEMARQLQRGFSLNFENRYICKDGSVKWLSWRATYVKDEGITYATARDITEMKLTEEALHNSEAFIKNILQTVDEGFIVVDRDYRILSANRAYCSSANLSAEQVLGRTCHEISHHLQIPCFETGEECPVRRAFETGDTCIASHTHFLHGGDKRYVEIKAFPVRDTTGNVVSAIETINDITERTLLEDQLRHAQKLESLGTLAGGVAHDFNNILTAIIGYGGMMEMRMAKDDRNIPYIREIIAAADRAAHLTQALLIFSRKQIAEMKQVGINELIEGMRKMILRLIGEDIDTNISISGGKLVVMGDYGQLEQVLMNLATNARDAMPDGGSLSIRTEMHEMDSEFIEIHGFGKQGKYALISVSDTGEGMDETTRERIFEPFFTTKGVGKGTGLGLSIVYGIVKKHNGYINCYSEPGSGTTFKIYLPVVREELVDAEEAVDSPIEGGSETILIADDDDSVRGLTIELLERYGYTVIEARDGAEAVVKFLDHKEKVNLVLLDVIMPKKSGREAFEEIRDIRSDVKILFISGYTEDIIQRKRIIEDQLPFLQKPAKPKELLGKIREILDAKK
ncbi:MAG: PAS domain S-box protein [Nitrospirae bacterium]|nr:PAS domain S-box protein [Nitrospirota bacterium]